VKLTGTMIFASEWNYHFDKFDLKYIAGGTHYNYALTGPTPVDQAPIATFQMPRVLPAGTLGAGSPTVVIPGGGPLVHPRYIFNYHEALNWISHEINIASTDKGPLQWIGGLYYYDEDYVQPVYTTLNDAPNLGINLSDGVCGATGGICPVLPGNNRLYDDRPSLNTKSKAVFGQVDYSFAEHWKVTAGLRYTKDHKKGQESLRLLCYDLVACGVAPELLGANFHLDLTQLPTVISGLVPGQQGAPGTDPGVSSLTTVDPATGFATRHYDDQWSATTGTFIIQYNPDPDTNVYFNYSRGFKAGAFRIGIDTTIQGFPSSKPEHMNAFEIGLKKDFGRTLQVNTAAFYYDYENDQIPLVVAATAGGLGQTQNIFFNVPKARSVGFELESIWQPIEHLQILANYSYTDAHVTKSIGVVDPADPAALAPGAKPLITFAQCVANPTSCTADQFTAGPTVTPTGTTTPGAYIQQTVGGPFVPIQSVIGAGNGGFQRPQDITGNQLPNSPKNKIAINVNYTWMLEPGSLIGSVNYVWRDKQFGSLFDRSYYMAPSYDQWDARLTYKDKDNKYTIIAFVKNIFNDLGYEGGSGAGRRTGLIPAYILGVGCTSPTATCTANTPVPVTVPGTPGQGGIAQSFLLTPPRTYGIELQYRF
jgi:iron complex outermembrane receptor protein